MNNSSQNALLKTLEEPASKSFIIMTVNRSNSLQKTIYSRCQNIKIPNIPKSEVDDLPIWITSSENASFMISLVIVTICL